jgi:hypothetical protein
MVIAQQKQPLRHFQGVCLDGPRIGYNYGSEMSSFDVAIRDPVPFRPTEPDEVPTKATFKRITYRFVQIREDNGDAYGYWCVNYISKEAAFDLLLDFFARNVSASGNVGDL